MSGLGEFSKSTLRAIAVQVQKANSQRLDSRISLSLALECDTLIPSMPNDAYEFFRQQLTQLTRRVERLEGKVEQLRSESIRPGLMFPNRCESQQLDDRVKKLESGN